MTAKELIERVLRGESSRKLIEAPVEDFVYANDEGPDGVLKGRFEKGPAVIYFTTRHYEKGDWVLEQSSLVAFVGDSAWNRRIFRRLSKVQENKITITDARQVKDGFWRIAF